MAKFNVKTTGKTKTTNLAGGVAYSESPELELVSVLLTSFVQDQYYQTEEEGRERLMELINAVKDKKFVAKAAIYARQEFGMRSVSHVTAAELAKIVKGEKWTKNFYKKVVARTDDITEILAYYLNKYGKPIPNSLKKGLVQALLGFDEYQLAKYRGEGKAVSLVDAVNLLHPKPSKELAKTFKKLVEGTLKSKGTWEAELTGAGQKAKGAEQKKELKKKAWSELVKERKIGYFALLRNLRNILKEAPGAIDGAVEMLTDKHLIERSKVLPFRFLTAIKAIEEMGPAEGDIQKILRALNEATDLALENVPHFEGKTLVAMDSSSSMMGTFGAEVRGTPHKPGDIGALFAAILIKNNDADYMTFGTEAEYQAYNTADSSLTIAQQMISRFHTSYTNFGAVFEKASKKYDRIIFLSDMQGWVATHPHQQGGAPIQQHADYRQRHDANPLIYSLDLAGYGTLQFPESNVFALAGFSEKVFKIMELLETDRKALIKEIEKIEL